MAILSKNLALLGDSYNLLQSYWKLFKRSLTFFHHPPSLKPINLQKGQRVLQCTASSHFLTLYILFKDETFAQPVVSFHDDLESKRVIRKQQKHTANLPLQVFFELIHKILYISLPYLI